MSERELAEIEGRCDHGPDMHALLCEVRRLHEAHAKAYAKGRTDGIAEGWRACREAAAKTARARCEESDNEQEQLDVIGDRVAVAVFALEPPRETLSADRLVALEGGAVPFAAAPRLMARRKDPDGSPRVEVVGTTVSAEPWACRACGSKLRPDRPAQEVCAACWQWRHGPPPVTPPIAPRESAEAVRERLGFAPTSPEHQAAARAEGADSLCGPRIEVVGTTVSAEGLPPVAPQTGVERAPLPERDESTPEKKVFWDGVKADAEATKNWPGWKKAGVSGSRERAPECEVGVRCVKPVCDCAPEAAEHEGHPDTCRACRGTGREGGR